MSNVIDEDRQYGCQFQYIYMVTEGPMGGGVGKVLGGGGVIVDVCTI